MLPRWTVLAWVTLLLLLVPPSDSFFFFGVDDIEEADGYEIINPLDSWFLGGATSIVYNAITLNFFGIKEKLRNLYYTIGSAVLFDGTGLVISSVVNIVVAVVAAVVDVTTTIISNIIETSWRKKLAFLEFLFRVATGRSLDGAVEFARVLSKIDAEDPL